MDIRDEFEKLPEIAETIKHGIYYDGKSNRYWSAVGASYVSLARINGAWYAFQEQQKKKDLAISKIKAFEKNTSADQVLFLNDLLIELKGMLK